MCAGISGHRMPQYIGPEEQATPPRNTRPGSHHGHHTPATTARPPVCPRKRKRAEVSPAEIAKATKHYRRDLALGNGSADNNSNGASPAPAISLLDLPEEILIRIVSMVPQTFRLCKLPQVCRDFLRLSQDDSLGRVMCFNGDNYAGWDTCRGLVSRHAKEVTFQHMTLDHLALNELFFHCLKLESLTFRNCEINAAEVLPPGHLKSLTIINESHLPFSPVPLNWSRDWQYNNLTRLTVSNFWLPTSISSEPSGQAERLRLYSEGMAKALPNLRALHVIQDVYLDYPLGDVIIAFLSAHSGLLEELTVPIGHEQDVSPSLLPRIFALAPKLRVLQLEFEADATGHHTGLCEALGYITALKPALDTLRIGCLVEAARCDDQIRLAVQALAGTLRHLRIQDFELSEGQLLGLLGHVDPRMQAIHLRKAGLCMTTAVMQRFARLSSLKELVLDQCWSDNGRPDISALTRLGSLETLGLAGCPTADVIFFKALATKAPRLCHLDVSLCPNIGLRGIAQIARLPSLSTLKLNTPRWYYAGAIRLCTFPCLRRLELRSTVVWASELPELFSVCPLLTALDVSDCVNLTAEDVRSFRKALGLGAEQCIFPTPLAGNDPEAMLEDPNS